MKLLSSGLLVLALVCGICQSHQHSERFISTNNEILTAFTWASLDTDVLNKQLPWLSSLHELNYTHPLYENVTELILSKPRKKRTIELQLDGDIFIDLEARMIFPLFEVHESTFFRFEIPINYGIPFPFITVNKQRSWDSSLGTAMRHIEDLVSMLGVDGSACVKRTVCELSASPSMNLHGFVGEVVQILMRHITEDSLEDGTEDNDIEDSPEKPTLSKGEYMKAGEYGRQKGDCWNAYPECPFSLFNMMAKS